MRYFISVCAAVAAAFFIINVIPTETEAALYDNVVRLHIIANSDSDEDQLLKTEVRDAVIAEFGERLEGFSDSENARDELALLLGDIEEYTNAIIAEKGFRYASKATLCRENYETRSYGEVTLPAGEYHSLKIILGDGKGKNWWCVLYPSMCLDFSLGEARAVIDEEKFVKAGFTKEQYKIITESEEVKYKIKLRLLEIINEMFGAKK